MRNFSVAMFLLCSLLILPLLVTGCGDDDESQTFQLNDCRLDDANCRLQ